MREADLPSPGLTQNAKAMHLRRIAANMISSLDVIAPKYPNGAHPDAAKLVAFFNAAAAAAATIGKARPAMTLATAGNATTVAVGATLATTVGKGGSSGAVTYVSSNPARATVNASGVVTGVAPGAVTITANMAEGTGHKKASRSVALTVVAA